MPAADIERAAHIYAEAEASSFSWGLGVTEHLYGSEVVQLICNLTLMTGNVGKPGAALLPLRGQNNVQGSSDMGALPDCYTAYRSVEDEEVARSFEAKWGVPLQRAKGYTIPQMFDAAVEGKLKAMYIFGEDVAQTDPDTAHVVHALENLEFLVCQEIFENTTTAYADVILPAASFLEKEGTFTNAERRVQLVMPAMDPPGSALPDFEILTRVSRGARARDGLRDARRRDGRDRRADARLRGHHATSASAARACSGPSSPTAPTRRSCTSSFNLPGGLGRFAPLPYKEPGDRRRRRVPADPRHRPPARALQRRHDDAPHAQRRAARPATGSRSIPTMPSALGIDDGDMVSIRSRVGQIEQEARDHRADRARATSSRRSTSPSCARTCSSVSRRTSTRRARSTR